MFSMKHLSYFVVFLFLSHNPIARNNLYFTDLVDDSNSNEVLQHHCLYTNGQDGKYFLADFGLSIAYCLSEPLKNFNIEKNGLFPSFTFAQLSKQNVTSEQLYLWSAPIDLIEHYQYYLNQLSTTNNSLLSEYVFYNCSWPRFGSYCEFEFDVGYLYKISSLSEFLVFYSSSGIWNRINWTCYTHLACERSIGMKCLDWTDICDGKVDCLNGGLDEEHCWQLEINVCNDKTFSEFYANTWLPEHRLFQGGLFINSNCVHLHTEYKHGPMMTMHCALNPIDTDCDEMVCRYTILTSSCLNGYPDLLETLYSIKENSTSNECWTAFKYLLKTPNRIGSTMDRFELMLKINETCPDMMPIPAVPILFNDISIVYIRNQSWNIINETYLYFYLCSNNSFYNDYFRSSSPIVFNNLICYQSIQWQIDSFFEDLSNLFEYRYGSIHRYNPFLNSSLALCHQSNLFYQCINSSKCVSIYRLMDGIDDCPFLDDEHLPLSDQYQNSHYKCPSSGNSIPVSWISDGMCDCQNSQITTCYDEWLKIENIRSTNQFSVMCDGILDLPSININGQEKTDETDCEDWPCLNYYTRCNTVFNCANRKDEEFCNRTQSEPSSYLSSQNPVVSNIREQTSSHCHRGIRLRVWISNRSDVPRLTCLCPPNYYGNLCQYQNERVNVYLAFEAVFDSDRKMLVAIVSLIDDDDNQRIIHSYRQFTLRDKIDCAYRYFLSLIYSTRPKNQTKPYSIHIDIYEKSSLGYRGSFLLLVLFPFLPVHRLVQRLTIPPHNDSIILCSNRQCSSRGRCFHYLNDSKNRRFCQCNRGWSGKSCQIKSDCTCSSDSLCIGVSAHNRSVCVCPMNRLGVRCLIPDLTCPTKGNLVCRNQAQCVSFADAFSTNGNFRCLCRRGFHGKFCEISDHRIELSFGKDVRMLHWMYIHFFKLDVAYRTDKQTISRIILTKQDSIIVYWKYDFNLILIEFAKANSYYFIAKQMKQADSQNLTKRITASDRCLHINELLNQSIANLHFISRVKYYYLICQTYASSIPCFYDESQVCVCDYFDQQSHPYCYNSTASDSYLCKRHNNCYNGGQCFEDSWFCPRRVWCTCPSCYYGTQCQFSTSGFGLSLDSILNYHIQPNIKLVHQPATVLTTAILSIIFVIIGLINSLLSLITFTNKSIRQVGCGIYLLTLSIATLLITVLFGLKVWILLLTQNSLIENRLFLTIQCHSIDFLLRSCLSMDQWLSACVAVERTVCVIQDVRFNKKKSKQVAKLMIILLLIFNIGTNIHDSIYRKVVHENNNDDEHSRRNWCILVFPSSHLSTYNRVILTFHFFAPFFLNSISLIILVAKRSHYHRAIHPEQELQSVLRQHFRQHKHLLTAPIGSVILSIPRLIIAYATKCMETETDVWLYLLAYFISFIPPMLTFLVFVMPSKVFKNQFKKSVLQYRQNLRHILQRGTS